MVKSPFIIFGLPRSRTTWLSHWLSYGGQVGHDLGIDCNSVQDFLDCFWQRGMIGTVETGAMEAGALLRYALPAARFVAVRRPLDEVEASLARFGVVGMRPELERRERCLTDLVDNLGAVQVHYTNLVQEGCCAALFEYCLGVPFDAAWWGKYRNSNIQVDLATEMARSAARSASIEAVKAETRALTDAISSNNPPQFARVGLERWDTFWPEAKRLGEDHYEEVGSAKRPGPAYGLDADLMAQMDATGLLRIMTARVNERLAGYCLWSITRDAERGGVPIADQGPWYVAPFANRALKLGMRMVNASIEMFRSMGILDLELHHNIEGRGARAGAWFQRLGAVEYQRRYSLHLEA